MTNRQDLERDLAEARERILSAPDTDADKGAARDAEKATVRESILASWRRSELLGIVPDRLAPPFDPDIDPESQLLRAAGPVLDRLEEVLGNTSMVVGLSDARGRLLARRCGEQNLNGALDRLNFTPGFNYSEQFIGTNGIGVAIEERGPAHVFGSEHYSGRLRSFSCVAAPVLHPLTGRLAGVVNLSCLSRRESPLMMALAREAAGDVTQQMLTQSTEGEQALLREFLAACQRTSRPVLTLRDDLIMANAKASALLSNDDQRVLRARAAELTESTPHSISELTLSNGQTATLRCRPVHTRSGPAGAVVEISVRTGDPRPLRTGPAHPMLPGLAGQSPAWLRGCREADALCRDRRWMLVRGEPGTGKMALINGAHQRWYPGTHLSIVDTSASQDDLDGWLDSIREALESPTGTIVLTHLDSLDSGSAKALDEVLAPVYRATVGLPESARPWLVGTLRTMVPVEQAGEIAEPDVLARYFDASVAIPPLRHRVGDVRFLAPALLTRYAAGREVNCSAEVLQILLRQAWPGNVSQLASVLREALLRRPAGALRVEDLPSWCHAVSRRVLTSWESLERDAIVRALVETGGDKARAAEQLGISRATIYRRISMYGIVVAGS